MKRRLAVAVFGAWFAMAGLGEAAPIQYVGNGHWYEFISGTGVTWATALSAADASTLGALDGYLVTITDAAENAFLDGNFGDGYWIAASDEDVEGTWKWKAGPETGTTFWQSGFGTITYANWNNGEPNDASGEDYATENLFGSSWNDWCTNCLTNYVVEYSDVNGPAVPEPASLTLLGTGIAGLVARARRRRSASR